MKIKQSYKLPIIISVLLHIIILICLFIRFPHATKQAESDTKIVQAVVVNSGQVASLTPPKQATPSPTVKAIPQTQMRQIEQVALKEPQSNKPMEQPVAMEKPQPPKPVEKAIKQEEVALQEPKIEATPMQKEAIQKKKEEQRKQEIKKKEEKLAQKRKEEEATQLEKELALESKQVATAQTESKTEDDEIAPIESDDGTAGEKSDAAPAEAKGTAKVSSNDAGELDKYKQLIISAISKRWIMPDTENKSLACQLLVHVGPGGVVLNVDILKESGDENLDRSARNAIMKASPLPVPEDAELFDNFRALRLTFRPQGIVSS